MLARILGATEAGPREGFNEFLPRQEELFNWPCLIDFKVGGLDMCVNRVVLMEFLVMLVVAAFFIIAFRRPKVVPRGMQNAMEAVYENVAGNVVDSVIGRAKGITWQPYLMILFVFVFFISLLEVIPGLQFPLSSRIAVPMFLAIGSLLIYNYAGIKEHGFVGYFKGLMFPAGVPKGAYILLTPIELITALVIRPATLTIRLFANFFAGHLLLTVFFFGAAYLLAEPTTIPFGVAAVVMSVLLVGLEIFIAAVQAYVFTILTAVYISLSVSHEH